MCHQFCLYSRNCLGLFTCGNGKRHAALCPDLEALSDRIADIVERLLLRVALAYAPRNRRTLHNVDAVLVALDGCKESQRRALLGLAPIARRLATL